MGPRGPNLCIWGSSSYPKDSKFYDLVNEKVIGKMEGESKGKINDEFVELKSKMQSIKDADGKESKTEEKIYKNVVKNTKQCWCFV